MFFYPHEDIKIIETGIRPGEKLYEELRFETEETAATEHPKIFLNRISGLDPDALQIALLRLSGFIRERDEAGRRSFLSDLLPEAQLNGHQQVAQVSVEGASPAPLTPVAAASWN